MAVLPIELWMWTIDASSAQVDHWRSYLNEDERGRVARFKFQSDKNRFIVCRSRIRRILGWYTRVAPRDVSFDYGENEKPKLAVNNVAVSFNLSHTQGVACLAVTRGPDIGVDLEHARDIGDDFVDYVLNPSELSIWQGLPADRKIKGFFRVWTAKEAYVKAVGEGLLRSLKSFDVSVAVDPAIGEFAAGRFERIECDSSRNRDWRLFSFTPSPAYIGALVIDATGYDDIDITVRNLTIDGQAL